MKGKRTPEINEKRKTWSFETHFLQNIISLVVCTVYVIIAFAVDASSLVFSIILFAVIPIVCIWFADEIAGFKEVKRHFKKEKKERLIRLLGWVLILLPFIGILMFVIFNSIIK